MTAIGDIWAAMLAEAADLPVDVEISDWMLDELLLEDTGEVRYYSLWQGETKPEWRSGPPIKFALFVSARPVVLVEDGRRVGRWRVDRGIIDEFDMTNRVCNLGYFGTLLEALEAIEAYIREVSDS